MRVILLMLVALLAPCVDAAVSYYQPDASDMWWNPSESGWGVNVVVEQDVMFATLFVYGADGRARWYVAPDMRTSGAPADVPQDFVGRLYETTGPMLTNAPFNPGAVGVRDVGEARFEYVRPSGGYFSYSVDGVSVSKQVRRQTWRSADITGEFFLNRVLRTHLCGGPNTGREPSVDEPGIMTVTQSADAVRIDVRPVAPSSLSCTYTGTASQEGRMASVTGTYSCSDGSSGPFSLSEIQVSNWGFMGLVRMNVRGCNMSGPFGGARTTMFEWPS
jgi:hypothetical protein